MAIFGAPRISSLTVSIQLPGEELMDLNEFLDITHLGRLIMDGHMLRAARGRPEPLPLACQVPDSRLAPLPPHVRRSVNLYTVANLGDALAVECEGIVATEGALRVWRVRVFRSRRL